MENICGFVGITRNPAASYGAKDIVPRWAVFATIYRESADDIVLWPKHGLPIQPGPDEGEVALGQVVTTAEPYPTLRSRGRVAQEGAYTPTAGKLGSFDREAKGTSYGVTTNAPTCGSHGRDARGTGTSANGDHGGTPVLRNVYRNWVRLEERVQV